jgi:hypothetical protein
VQSAKTTKELNDAIAAARQVLNLKARQMFEDAMKLLREIPQTNEHGRELAQRIATNASALLGTEPKVNVAGVGAADMRVVYPAREDG